MTTKNSIDNWIESKDAYYEKLSLMTEEELEVFFEEERKILNEPNIEAKSDKNEKNKV